MIDDRTAFGQGLADEFVKSVKKAGPGATVVSRQFTNDKATDFNAILTQIRARDPDVIFYGGMDAVAGPMLKQMKALGLRAKLVSGDGVCSEKMPLLAGDALVDDKVFCVVAGGVSGPQEAGLDAFTQRYQQRYKIAAADLCALCLRCGDGVRQGDAEREFRRSGEIPAGAGRHQVRGRHRQHRVRPEGRSAGRRTDALHLPQGQEDQAASAALIRPAA